MKQEKTERVEVYYERLLKLVDNLQHKTTNNFLTIIFKYGLQPNLHVTIVSTKRKTLQQHKEVVLVCEKGIYEVKVINNLLIPHNSKTISAQKPHTIIEKSRMYCIIYHRTNHNVETYKVKEKENYVPIVSEVTPQQIKVQRPLKYSCHICDDIGHKIIDCPKYNDM
jgi:hypothetical protein